MESVTVLSVMKQVMSHWGGLLICRVGGWTRLTAVDTKMLLQVMFVFEGFSTLAALELAVSSSFVEQRRLQTEAHTEWSCDGGRVGRRLHREWNRSWRGNLIVFSKADLIETHSEKQCGLFFWNANKEINKLSTPNTSFCLFHRFITNQMISRYVF